MLGKGQSVVFCIPEEIQMRIREQVSTSESTANLQISVPDVLAWAITETWQDAERSIPLWTAQGRRYQRHKEIWDQIGPRGKTELYREEAERFREQEAQSLDTRYRPRYNEVQTLNSDNLDPITMRCSKFRKSGKSAAALQEEQERELSPEVEQEREDQRPPPAQPAKHIVHSDILQFISSGKLKANSWAYMPAFGSLSDTSAASSFGVPQFPSGLLVTADFENTIKVRDSSYVSDSYQRPVQWILTSASSHTHDVEHMMVISPHEAQELYQEISKSKRVALHIYAPRPNLGYRPLDKLDLYTVPQHLAERKLPQSLIVELNLFAGQLYLSSHQQYIDVCRFIGLAWEPTREDEVIAADGFIIRDCNGRVGGDSGLQKSPVEFLKVMLTKIRRNCESIDKTHMGKILDNQLLTPAEFEVNRETLGISEALGNMCLGNS